MKRIIFLGCLVLLVVKGYGQQLKGEIDAISFPEFDQNLRIQKKVDLNRSPRYDEGWDQGYTQALEDAAEDAETCNPYQDPSGIVCPSISHCEDQDFLDGFDDGYYSTYGDAYQAEIDAKAAACPVNFEFDEFDCECICIEQTYYYDGDGDNFFDFATLAKYQCDPPSVKWKTEFEFDGIDCDDSDPDVHSYDECGRCSSTSGITTWYFDGDGDGYHGDMQESCSQPVTGGSGNWKIITSGEDCDDTDREANETKNWYYYGDDDSYWGISEESCLRPQSGVATNWSPDPMSGFDCNDEDSNIFGEVKWYYDGDGDGYHGQTVTSCRKPATGVESKWLIITNGPDCDDADRQKFVENNCGVCGSSVDEQTLAYLDLDGDGYHSAIFESYSEPICPNLPIILSFDLVEDLTDLNYIITNHDLIEPEHPSRLCEDHHHFWYRQDGKYNGGVRECEYFNGYIWHSEYFGDAYFEFLGGKKLWVSLSYNDNILRVFLSGFTDNFILSETKGQDCDDLNGATKAFGDWYFDGDGDGYHNTDIAPHENTCTPPSDEWILIENSAGPDCNDDDPEETVLITWYFDGDLDEYYSTTVPTQQSCENPAKGTGDEAKWRQDTGNGPDCYDDDREANAEDRIWYYDFDRDNYYGATTTSCRNPAIDTPEAELWKPDPGEGEDCDDDDPDSQTFNACGVCGGSDDPSPQYIDIDGDGYHSVYKFEDCGLNEFPGSLVRAGLPPSVVGYGTQDLVLTFPAHLTHLTGITMPYDAATDTYTVPDEIIFTTSLGLDCDDVSSSELSNGEWYPDVDGDGYHDESVAPVIGCIPPDADTYILLANSSGPDCDDTDRGYHTNKIWYYDSDGDGYYTDSQVSCQSPGEFWNTMSGIGFDDDDDDPFSPGLVPASLAETFSIPSVIDIVGEEPYEQLEYNGNLYDPSQITIHYRGVTFTYDDLIFERASPEITLQSNSLLIPEGHPLMDAVIKVSGEPVQSLVVRSERTYIDSDDEQDLRPDNDWVEKVKQQYPGYNSVHGDLTLNDVAAAGDYFKELFDPAQFNVFKHHYDTYGHPPFGVKIQTFIEPLAGDINAVETPVVDEIIGPAANIGVIITARKTAGTIEYVVSFRDETFEPTNEGLESQGWKDADGNWTGDLTDSQYNLQLSEMRKFRKLMVGNLAHDYNTLAAVIPAPPNVPTDVGLPDLPPEEFPTYNYGTWGFLTKLVEFCEVGHHVTHEFKVPDGIWDPASEDWARWRAKAPASVSGAMDASIREIRDLADMMKLAQSLCYKKTWEQILEAVKNFNAGEQVRAMISSFEDKIETLQGNNGVEKQYYEIGVVTVITLSGIYSAWKLAKKTFEKLTRPIDHLEQKHSHLTETFAEQINKSPQFSNLSKELQEKLTDDLARLKDDGAFANALASNPDLVDSWKVLENNPILRKKPENLENISKWLDEGIESQKLTDGIAKSRSKQNLIDELGTAKSKLHAQVLIKDYDNIPGVAKGRYFSNSSTMADKADLPSGWSSDFDINQRTVETFTEKIEPLELKPGDKIYRVSNVNGGGGPYWTRTKPNGLDDVIGGTAVQPEWNNFEYIFEYTVPEGKTIKTWKGKAARQQVSDTSPSNYHLSGGDEQLFIGYMERQDPTFQSIVKSTKAEW